VHQRRSRYETGLQKLLAAEAEVATMKQELIELQPKLIQTQKEVRGGAAPRTNCCHLARWHF
jgi:dynein heavy chain